MNEDAANTTNLARLPDGLAANPLDIVYDALVSATTDGSEVHERVVESVSLLPPKVFETALRSWEALGVIVRSTSGHLSIPEHMKLPAPPPGLELQGAVRPKENEKKFQKEIGSVLLIASIYLYLSVL